MLAWYVSLGPFEEGGLEVSLEWGSLVERLGGDRSVLRVWLNIGWVLGSMKWDGRLMSWLGWDSGCMLLGWKGGCVLVRIE